MTFYQFAVHLIKIIFHIFNGKPKVQGLENIPQDQAVIFAATHRSYTDPFFLADVLYPRTVAFMAKDTLFRHKIIGSLLKRGHVFPVNREKPAASSIKHAVNLLKGGEMSLGIFPSGTRHSTEIKGGTAFIQKMAKVSIIPVAIQPPIGFWQFFLRKKAKINFGAPIEFDPNQKYDKDKLAEIDQLIGKAFNQLDKELDPNYLYTPK